MDEKTKNTILQKLESADAKLSNISVSGEAVFSMGGARVLLREVYDTLKKGETENE